MLEYEDVGAWGAKIVEAFVFKVGTASSITVLHQCAAEFELPSLIVLNQRAVKVFQEKFRNFEIQVYENEEQTQTHSTDRQKQTIKTRQFELL